jgi:hypothetical protein
MSETNTEEIDLLHKTKLVVCSNCGAETNLHPVQDVFFPKLCSRGTANNFLIMNIMSQRKKDIKLFMENIKGARETGRGKRRQVILELCVDVDTGQDIMRQIVSGHQTQFVLLYVFPLTDYLGIQKEIESSIK